MRRQKYFEIKIILLVDIVLCLLVVVRVLTNEFIVEYLGIHNTLTSAILRDINSTVDEYESDDIVTVVRTKLDAYTTSAMPFTNATNKVVTVITDTVEDIPKTYTNMKSGQDIAGYFRIYFNACADVGGEYMFVGTPTPGSLECVEEKAELSHNADYEEMVYGIKYYEDNDIRAIDMAKVFAKECPDKLGYDPSDHWLLTSALYATKDIVAIMNENYGFEYDVSQYELDDTYDYLDELAEDKEYILNSFGKDYVIPIPNCAKEDIVEITHDGQVLSGLYAETVYKRPEEILPWAYYCYTNLQHKTLFHNVTTTANKGKKVVVVGDSFSWPIVNYLCAQTEYVLFLHEGEAGICDATTEFEPDFMIVAKVRI